MFHRPPVAALAFSAVCACTSPTQSWLPATTYQGTRSPTAVYTSWKVAATRWAEAASGSGAGNPVM